MPTLPTDPFAKFDEGASPATPVSAPVQPDVNPFVGELPDPNDPFNYVGRSQVHSGMNKPQVPDEEPVNALTAPLLKVVGFGLTGILQKLTGEQVDLSFTPERQQSLANLLQRAGSNIFEAFTSPLVVDAGSAFAADPERPNDPFPLQIPGFGIALLDFQNPMLEIGGIPIIPNIGDRYDASAPNVDVDVQSEAGGARLEDDVMAGRVDIETEGSLQTQRQIGQPQGRYGKIPVSDTSPVPDDILEPGGHFPKYVISPLTVFGNLPTSALRTVLGVPAFLATVAKGTANLTADLIATGMAETHAAVTGGPTPAELNELFGLDVYAEAVSYTKSKNTVSMLNEAAKRAFAFRPSEKNYDTAGEMWESMATSLGMRGHSAFSQKLNSDPVGVVLDIETFATPILRVTTGAAHGLTSRLNFIDSNQIRVGPVQQAILHRTGHFSKDANGSYLVPSDIHVGSGVLGKLGTGLRYSGEFAGALTRRSAEAPVAIAALAGITAKRLRPKPLFQRELDSVFRDLANDSLVKALDPHRFQEIVASGVQKARDQQARMKSENGHPGLIDADVYYPNSTPDVSDQALPDLQHAGALTDQDGHVTVQGRHAAVDRAMRKRDEVEQTVNDIQDRIEAGYPRTKSMERTNAMLDQMHDAIYGARDSSPSPLSNLPSDAQIKRWSGQVSYFKRLKKQKPLNAKQQAVYDTARKSLATAPQFADAYIRDLGGRSLVSLKEAYEAVPAAQRDPAWHNRYAVINYAYDLAAHYDPKLSARMLQNIAQESLVDRFSGATRFEGAWPANLDVNTSALDQFVLANVEGIDMPVPRGWHEKLSDIQKRFLGIPNKRVTNFADLGLDLAAREIKTPLVPRPPMPTDGKPGGFPITTDGPRMAEMKNDIADMAYMLYDGSMSLQRRSPSKLKADLNGALADLELAKTLYNEGKLGADGTAAAAGRVARLRQQMRQKHGLPEHVAEAMRNDVEALFELQAEGIDGRIEVPNYEKLSGLSGVELRKAKRRNADKLRTYETAIQENRRQLLVDPMAMLTPEMAKYYVKYQYNAITALRDLNADMKAVLLKVIEKYPDMHTEVPAAKAYQDAYVKGGLWEKVADGMHHWFGSPARYMGHRVAVPMTRAKIQASLKSVKWMSRILTTIGDFGPNQIPTAFLQKLVQGKTDLGTVLDTIREKHGDVSAWWDYRTYQLVDLLNTDVRTPKFEAMFAEADARTRDAYPVIRQVFDEIFLEFRRSQIRNNLKPTEFRAGYYPNIRDAIKDLLDWDQNLASIYKDDIPKDKAPGALVDALDRLNKLHAARTKADQTFKGELRPGFAETRKQDADLVAGGQNISDVLSAYINAASRAIAWNDVLPILRRERMAMIQQGRSGMASLLDRAVLAEMGYRDPSHRGMEEMGKFFQGFFRERVAGAVVQPATSRFSTENLGKGTGLEIPGAIGGAIVGTILDDSESDLEFGTALGAAVGALGGRAARSAGVTGLGLPVKNMPYTEARVAQRMAARVNRWQARYFLGLNIQSAVRNLSDQMRLAAQHGTSAWADAAPGGVTSGVQSWWNELFRREQVTKLTASGATENWAVIANAIDKSAPHWMDAITLATHQAPEYINRGIAFNHGLMHALKPAEHGGLGLTPAQAMAVAAESVEYINFKYDTPFVSPYFRNPLIGTATTFAKYRLRWWEFALHRTIDGVRGMEDLVTDPYWRTATTRGDWKGGSKKLLESYKAARFLALTGFAISVGDPQVAWDQWLQAGSESGFKPWMFGFIGAASARNTRHQIGSTVPRPNVSGGYVTMGKPIQPVYGGGWTYRTMRNQMGATHGAANMTQRLTRGAVGYALAERITDDLPRWQALHAGDMVQVEQDEKRGGTKMVVRWPLIFDDAVDMEVSVRQHGINQMFGPKSNELVQRRGGGRWVTAADLSPFATDVQSHGIQNNSFQVEKVKINDEWKPYRLTNAPKELQVPFTAFALGVDFNSWFGHYIPPNAERHFERGDFLNGVLETTLGPFHGLAKKLLLAAGIGDPETLPRDMRRAIDRETPVLSDITAIARRFSAEPPTAPRPEGEEEAELDAQLKLPPNQRRMMITDPKAQFNYLDTQIQDPIIDLPDMYSENPAEQAIAKMVAVLPVFYKGVPTFGPSQTAIGMMDTYQGDGVYQNPLSGQVVVDERKSRLVTALSSFLGMRPAVVSNLMDTEHFRQREFKKARGIVVDLVDRYATAVAKGWAGEAKQAWLTAQGMVNRGVLVHGFFESAVREAVARREMSLEQRKIVWDRADNLFKALQFQKGNYPSLYGGKSAYSPNQLADIILEGMDDVFGTERKSVQLPRLTP